MSGTNPEQSTQDSKRPQRLMDLDPQDVTIIPLPCDPQEVPSGMCTFRGFAKLVGSQTFVLKLVKVADLSVQDELDDLDLSATVKWTAFFILEANTDYYLEAVILDSSVPISRHKLWFSTVD